MPKLSQIAFEAERLLGHMQESKMLALQQALIGLCEARWLELRGPEPATPLAWALWSVTPPLADLFADLYTAGDARLDEALRGHRPAWGLALLALAEIARGNAQGVQAVHEPMMAFESQTAGAQQAARMAALLRGELAWPLLHRHAQQPPLAKALMLLTARTGRCDLEAVFEVIRLLAASKDSADAALEALRAALAEAGIVFVAVEGEEVRYAQRGHAHKATSRKQLAESLLAIRQQLLA